MISELYIRKEKGAAAQAEDFLTLDEVNGIVGDHHGGGDRALCLVTRAVLDEIVKDRENRPCARKFSPNIVLTESRDLAAGDTFVLGGAVVKLTAVGRECHGVCGLSPCALTRSVLFARIEKGGTVRIGDEMKNA